MFVKSVSRALDLLAQMPSSVVRELYGEAPLEQLTPRTIASVDTPASAGRTSATSCAKGSRPKI